MDVGGGGHLSFFGPWRLPGWEGESTAVLLSGIRDRHRKAPVTSPAGCCSLCLQDLGKMNQRPGSNKRQGGERVRGRHLRRTSTSGQRDEKG